MKLVKKAAVFLLSLMVLAGSMTPVQASDEEYTYTVRFFSGAQGTIRGQEVAVFGSLRYGDRVTFNQSAVKLKNNSKYYVKGVRESGKDNNTANHTTSFAVTGDQDYVVVYGVLGNSVAYTVRYEDGDGGRLAPEETYYGNVGDRPVLAFQYIEGYQPQAYNLTRVLTENAADNVFTFVYTPVAAGEEPEETGEGTTTRPTMTAPAGTVTPAQGAAAPTGDAPGTAATEDGETAAPEDTETAAEDGETVAPEETPDLVDLDNPEVPLDNPEVPLDSGRLGDGYGVASMLFELPLSAKTGVLSGVILLAVGGTWLYKSRKQKREVKNG